MIPVVSPDQNEEQKLITVSLLMLASVAVAMALIYTRSVMVPLVFAMFLSYIVRPLVDKLERITKLPRWGAVGVAFILICIVVLGTLGLIASSLTEMTPKLALYRERIIVLAEQTISWLRARGVPIEPTTLTEQIRNLPVLEWVQNSVGGIVDFLSSGTLVLIFTIYLLLGTRGPQSPSTPLVALMEKRIRHYLVTKTLLSLATGLLVGVILWIFGLELAFVFGLLAFLLNFIPNIGSAVATLLPLPVAFVQYDSFWPIVAVIALPTIVQTILGNMIEPKLIGESMDLHPITIMAMLVFWGLVWGIVGMILATPMTAVLKMVLEQFQTTQPVAHLLAGRWVFEKTNLGTAP